MPYVFEVPREKLNMPNVVNYPVEEAENHLVNAGFIVQTRGEGEIVCKQIPQGGVEVLSAATVILELQPHDIGAVEEITVPDLTGLSIKEAGSILEKLGLYLNPTGTGFAAGQQEEPYTRVRRGTIINVEFQPPAIKTIRD
ncbi:MAG: PASTA domain-containing protein [Candidatus Syntrophopropionicum ammoniitolerans]